MVWQRDSLSLLQGQGMRDPCGLGFPGNPCWPGAILLPLLLLGLLPVCTRWREQSICRVQLSCASTRRSCWFHWGKVQFLVGYLTKKLRLLELHVLHGEEVSCFVFPGPLEQCPRCEPTYQHRELKGGSLLLHYLNLVTSMLKTTGKTLPRCFFIPQGPCQGTE